MTAAVGEAVRLQAGFDPAASTGLFVGVSRFEDSRISEVPFAVDDAVDLAHLFALELELLAPNRSVLALAGEPRKEKTQAKLERLLRLGASQVSAQQTDIYRHVGQLSRTAGAEGFFLLSIATHGLSDQGGDFLIAADSLKERLTRTGVAVDEIFDEVSRSPAPRRLVLLDACRERLTAGTRGLEGAPMAKSFHDAIAAAAGQVVLSGATLGGFAYDDLERGNGVFTAAILDGLQGAAPADSRGLITVGTLAEFVQHQVADWVRRHRPYGAEKSLGIGRRSEGPAESLPLAVNLDLSRARDRYLERRATALVQLRENLGKIVTGTLHDRIFDLLPEEPPVSEKAKELLEELLEEIEALDGTHRTQRSLRDYFREHYGRPVGAPLKDPAVPQLPRATSPDPPPERRTLDTKKPDPLNRRPLLLGLAVVLALLGVWIVPRLFQEPNSSQEQPSEVPELSAQIEEDADAATDPGTILSASPLEVPQPHPQTASENEGDGEAAPIATRLPQQSSQVDAREERQAVAEPASTSQAATLSPKRRDPAAGSALEGPIGMRFHYVPAGTYTIGSPKDEPGRDDDETLRDVRLTRGFWLGETEVTQEQWTALVPTYNPSHFKACGSDCPVEQVSWFEAVTFANLLSARDKLDLCYDLQGCGDLGTEAYSCEGVRLTGPDCSGYRLPTEAEWEVAARAGTKTAIYTGELTLRGQRDGPELDPIAWYGGNSGVDYEGAYDCSSWPEKQYTSTLCGTHPVARKQKNSWELYDMLGNVWEWTWDSWQEKVPATLDVDPLGPGGARYQKGAVRVIRGGSWYSFARVVRAASRYLREPSYRYGSLGFRLARGQVRSSTAEPEPEAE